MRTGQAAVKGSVKVRSRKQQALLRLLVRCSAPDPHLRDGVVDKGGDAKVGQLGLAGGVHQDVGGLDVPVHLLRAHWGWLSAATAARCAQLLGQRDWRRAVVRSLLPARADKATISTPGTQQSPPPCPLGMRLAPRLDSTCRTARSPRGGSASRPARAAPWTRWLTGYPPGCASPAVTSVRAAVCSHPFCPTIIAGSYHRPAGR